MLSRARVRVLGAGVVLGVVAWVGVSGVVGACAEKKSAIMLAITTDMKAPKDVNAVSVTISTNGAVKHSFIGRVTPQGEIELPATLAVVEPEELGATVRVRVMAFQDNKPRVLRDVRTSIPKGGRTGLLRIPLNFANDGSTKSPPLPDGVLPPPRAGAVTPKSGNAGEFDFLASFQPDCPDVLNQTWIDGACADNEVKFESLPDFDPAAIVPASAAGCFDVAKCFAGATPVGERLDLKDGAPCTLALPEGGASGLNLALVTRDTGECNASGDCFIPLDRGASGFREEGGKIALPAYVCRLVKTQKARLFERRGGACASKEENQTACSGAGGSAADAGDAGGEKPVGTLVAKLGFATAVALSGKTLYAAGAKVGKLDLGGSAQALTEIAVPAPPNQDAGLPVDAGAPDASAPSAPRPWRLAAVASALAAADGSRSYLEDVAQGGLREVPPRFAVDVAAGGTLAYWATSEGAFFSDTREGSVAFPGGSPVSAIAAVEGYALVGRTGTLELCQQAGPSCQTAIPVSGAVFQSLAFDPATVPPQNFKAYALAATGVYEIPARDKEPPSAGLLPVTPSGSTGPLSEGTTTYARGIVAGAKCVYFTTTEGVEYATTGTSRQGGVLAASKKALGVALGADAASREVVYFTVFAAEEGLGGVYRVAAPAACASVP